MKWIYNRRNDLVSGYYRISENVYWGSKGRTKDYSLYYNSELLFTGSFNECKSFAENDAC